MSIEIERKFLLKPGFSFPLTDRFSDIEQCYLQTAGGNARRVRIISNQGHSHAFITIKGEPEDNLTIGRIELESHIPVALAETIIVQAERESIFKTRYYVSHDTDEDLVFEVDVFHGMNSGLIIIELELPAEDYKHSLPEWVGEEVTKDHRYTNAFLSDNPYSEW